MMVCVLYVKGVYPVLHDGVCPVCEGGIPVLHDGVCPVCEGGIPCTA